MDGVLDYHVLGAKRWRDSTWARGNWRGKRKDERSEKFETETIRGGECPSAGTLQREKSLIKERGEEEKRVRMAENSCCKYSLSLTS